MKLFPTTIKITKYLTALYVIMVLCLIILAIVSKLLPADIVGTGGELGSNKTSFGYVYGTLLITWAISTVALVLIIPGLAIINVGAITYDGDGNTL